MTISNNSGSDLVAEIIFSGDCVVYVRRPFAAEFVESKGWWQIRREKTGLGYRIYLYVKFYDLTSDRAKEIVQLCLRTEDGINWYALKSCFAEPFRVYPATGYKVSQNTTEVRVSRDVLARIVLPWMEQEGVTMHHLQAHQGLPEEFELC